ncbi:Equilibrative nucleoside transporter 3 [Echinococcus granulosus]|nr:Equilibrative nucleoside transporter 3 [Echinococcus granulosus]
MGKAGAAARPNMGAGVDSADEDSPKDRCRFVYIIFFFIGYFHYQLRNQSLPSDVDPLLPMYRTPLQTVFSSYLTIASIVPATLANFANLMLKDCLPVYTRLIGSAIVMLAMFTITTALTKVTVDTSAFFIITLVTVAINNVGSSINQGSTYGILTVLPGSNARGFLEGQAVAGIIASASNLITIAAASDPQDVGFAYFLIGVCIIAFTIGLFIILFKSPYFLYYWRSKDGTATDDDVPFSRKLKRTADNLYRTMWEVKWTGFTTLIIFAVTLAIFPSVFILIVPNNFDKSSAWHIKYFHAVIVFLSFNICDYLGRMAVGWFKWPTFEQRKLLLTLAIVRVILVPLAMLCNIPSQRIPTVFYHDSIPIILVILLGLTNGYFVSLAVSYAPRYASAGNEEGCGIATSTYISLGLCLGVTLSYGMVALV